MFKISQTTFYVTVLLGFTGTNFTTAASNKRPAKDAEAFFNFLTGKQQSVEQNKKALLIMLQRRKMQLNTQGSLYNFMQADFIDDKIAEAKCKIKYNTAMQDVTSMNPNKLCGPIFFGTPPSAEPQNPVEPQVSNSRLQFFTKALDEPQRLPAQNVFSLEEAQTTFAEILHQILANPHLLNDLEIPLEAFKELYELANNNAKIAPTEFFQKLQELAEKTIRQLLKSRGFKPRAVDFLTDASAAILPQMAKHTAKKYLEFAKAYEDAADFVQKQNLEMAHFLDEKTDGEAALALTKGHLSRHTFNPEMGLSHASKVRVNAIELSLGANIKSELARSNLENFFGKIAIAGIEFAKRSGLESMCNESGKVFDRQLEINTHFKILVQEKYAQITATKNAVALKATTDLQAANPEPAPPASESSPPPPPQSPPTPPSGFDPKKTAAQSKSINPQDSSLLDSLSENAHPTNARAFAAGIKCCKEQFEQEFAAKLSQSNESSYEAGLQDAKISQAEQDKNTAAKNALACKLGATLTEKKLKPKFEQKEQENRSLRSEVASKDKIIQQKDTALENKDTVIQDLEDKNKLFAHILSNFNEEQL